MGSGRCLNRMPISKVIKAINILELLLIYCIIELTDDMQNTKLNSSEAEITPYKLLTI